MPAIIPIPAFTHNYIRILRARRNCPLAKRDGGPLTVPASNAGTRTAEMFLRAGEPRGFAAAEIPAARIPARAVDAFAALREWKNKL